MNYLMYYIEGFIKKFPLNKPSITIGRSLDNNLVIKEDFISRSHVQVVNNDLYITVKDLQSTNGINYKDEKVKEAQIQIGESFILGKIEFFLKQGSLDEFKLAKELIPIFDTIGSDNEKKFDNTATRYIEDIYSETLKVVMHIGLKKNDFRDFLMDIGNHLSNLTDFGSLYIISKHENEFRILLSVQNESLKTEILKKVVKSTPDIYSRNFVSQPIPGIQPEAIFYSFPLKLDEPDSVLVFTGYKRKEKEDLKLADFLSRLVTEIDLLSQLLTSRTRQDAAPDQSESIRDDIVAESSQMKELIKQAQKIAVSDIFVLIQGESGTGKELFAKLIHKHSQRAKHKFVAINCAAIPESLLESELFGHEKGAFTGAYIQKKGKLEMASGGTLVLDEIGDMPINLQSKLLRALQEKEFYRLGGSTPITVDLRIISITNQDLKTLIKEGKFREDLYYRLVHRSISIPPLRDRKEDISALINYFTAKFCQQTQKKIGGYSVKAFETLQGYNWKGNVRQLENEIRSIVNLTDDGETVGYEILSDEIKELPDENTGVSGPGFSGGFSQKAATETEKEMIIRLLEKNLWNKSRTARDLKMTYVGLHKKLKRLGIEPPE